MQKYSDTTTIHPSLLSLNQYTTKTKADAHCASALDDVAITSGQADYNDEDYTSKTLSTDSNDSYSIDDFELTDEANLRYESSIQICSAPARVGGIGAFDPAAFSNGTGLLPTGGSQLWHHLQTSAPGASSAPGRNYTSSQFHQNGTLGPSALPDLPSITLTPSWGDQNYQQLSPIKQRFMYDVHHTQNSMRGNRFSGGDGAFGESCESEGSESSKISFLDQENEPTTASLMSTTAPVAIPQQRQSSSSRFVPSEPHIACCLPLYDSSMSQSPTSDFLPLCQLKDEDIMTGIGPSQLQDQSFIEEYGYPHSTKYAMAPTGGQAMWNGSLNPMIDWSHQDISGDRLQNTSGRVTQDYPPTGWISNPSQHYQPDQASSYPPTAGYWPYSMPVLQARQDLHSTSPASNTTSIPMRRKPSKDKPTRKHKSASLKSISKDDRCKRGLSPTGAVRGRRKGQLDPETALAAKTKRSEGTVCIRCKVMKMACEGDLPCEGCQKNSSARSWGSHCQRAMFVDIVMAGPCNAILQHSASVWGLDRSKGVIPLYPAQCNLKDLMDRLNFSESRYNIGVRQISGSQHTLSLSNFMEVMSRLNIAAKTGPSDLEDVVGSKLIKESDWLSCVIEQDPLMDVMDRLIEWSNMSSIDTYSYIPLNSASSRRMKVEDEQEECDFPLAAQLCRIFFRALEIIAFKALQSRLNNLQKKTKFLDTEIDLLALQLRKLLSTLRYRISRWHVIGPDSSIDDDLRETSLERATMLTQSLYFWYFAVKKKLSSLRGSSPMRRYDGHTVDNDSPDDESLDGFHAWMVRGQSTLQRSNAQYPAARPIPRH